MHLALLLSLADLSGAEVQQVLAIASLSNDSDITGTNSPSQYSH
jgi:translation initiation factor RLI1